MTILPKKKANQSSNGQEKDVGESSNGGVVHSNHHQPNHIQVCCHFPAQRIVALDNNIAVLLWSYLT